MITFISGGARSGKSSWAERMAFQKYMEGEKGRLYYLATGVRTDHEMEDRILRHQQERGNEWHTLEAPIYIGDALRSLENESVVLLDCLTIWLSNMMYSQKVDMVKILENAKDWLTLAKQKSVHIYIVSNDVNEGIPLNDDEVYRYIFALEHLHRLIIREAREVYQVVAGIPEKWKG
ncbi:bifunctional adenosylcobinamide kinase/adenosylcobinamide-phosphate guanylyltransferase [Bacillus sp. CGMCC 1.16607]|uniref:bifunctional adenosylcobinamide kinase/adenosylcobinamide-phosphate guanylyltransferase n=1 Tax=Bacillus sp. CGMCC 1.16607 TaxID=3351842 RepID=UPI00362CBDD3